MAELKLPSGHVALVDDDDIEAVIAGGPWHAHRDRNTFYARHRLEDGTDVKLHKFLTGYSMTDHINGNGLDNRRANLRPADPSLNQANRIHLSGRSGFRGVTLHKMTGRWQAAICVRRVQRYLGLYGSPEEAARAYDTAAIEAFGEYARPNFPVEVAS